MVNHLSYIINLQNHNFILFTNIFKIKVQLQWNTIKIDCLSLVIIVDTIDSLIFKFIIILSALVGPERHEVLHEQFSSWICFPSFIQWPLCLFYYSNLLQGLSPLGISHLLTFKCEDLLENLVIQNLSAICWTLQLRSVNECLDVFLRLILGHWLFWGYLLLWHGSHFFLLGLFSFSL